MALPTDTAGPFDVKADDLVYVDAEQAVDLFRQLLVIEAIKAGIPITGVDVPSAINVADGGIDAEVDSLLGTALPAGLISQGLTRYQIKTGNFSASTETDIRSLLVRPKFATGKQQRTKDEIQPRVLSCFEKGGTFIVVLFGSDLVGRTDDHGATEISKFMAAIDPSFAKIKVRIIRANQLCSAIKVLAPGIAMRLNRVQGYDDAVFHDMSFMADSCDLAIGGYQQTIELDSAAEQITRAADNINGFQHVRVLGDAGSGKTHLMYRALSASYLSGCVLYCRDPEQALTSGPMTALRQLARNTAIILVADECDLETSEELIALFKRLAIKMLLVTADNVTEHASAHANALIINMPQLEQPVVADIFKGYSIPSDSATWLATLCEGSPRAAHRLGQYIQYNPAEQPAQQLAHLDDLWERVVCAPHNIDSAEGHDKLVVIRTMALFRQVAWETSDGPVVQAAVLAALKQLDQTFSPLRLSRSVSELRKRRVLQGPRALLISPKLLHIAMWKSWFDQYSIAVDVEQLRESLGASMQAHFDAMLMFVQESKAATAWAERLMGDGGVFASLAGYEAASSARLFFAVAQAKPKAALRRFAAALGGETVDDRREFKGDARRTAVHRLEQLAIPSDTFFEAAQCLLLLAESENENWSNNSTGIFISLFSLGYGQIAASELAPIDKIDYLRELLRSEIPFRRNIAVRALSKSLSPFLFRTAIEEVIGLRRLPDRWKPKTYDELYDAYAAHVRLLEDSVEYLPALEAREAAIAIVSHARSLIQIAPLAKTILNFLRRAAAMPGVRDQCIEAVEAILYYEGKALSDVVVSELMAIRSELTESTFSNKLRRYAGMKLIEDHFDKDGKYADAAEPELIQLATEAVADPKLLIPDLSWLVTDEAKNGFQFGQILGQADDLKLWDSIISTWIEAGVQRSDFFVGGYLSSWYVKNVAIWEQLLECLFKDSEVRSSVLGLVWRSGMTDHIARTLLAMAQRGEIDPKAFRLFVYGNVVNQFPLGVIERVVDLLLEIDDANAPDAALDILDSRLRSRPDEMGGLSTRIESALNLSAFVEAETRGHANNDMFMYRWNEVANQLLEIDPEAAARLAVRCIENFARVNSVTAGFHPYPLKFLFNATALKPHDIWPAVAHRLETQRKDIGTWHLLNWLRGGRWVRENDEAGLNAIPAQMVFKWVDEDAKDRAWLFAEHCPPRISRQDEPHSFARQLLERYGEIEQVRRSLHANNFSEGWSGPASEHYRQKLTKLDASLLIEGNANVRIWLKEHREQLEISIEREVELELRESDS
jgi:beta-phosphoglucomutase-like phosphatase (HAD superfamily)